MNVTPGTAIYPLLVLWRYLISNSLVPIFGIRDSLTSDIDDSIPNELCSFINRLVLYFFVQVPAMFLIGTGIGMVFILMPVLASISLFFLGLEATLSDPVVGSFGLVIMIFESICLSLILGHIIHMYSKSTKCKSAKNAADVVLYLPKKALSPLKSFYEVIVMYYQAKHDKFCPRLEFNEKKVVVKKSKNTK